MSCIVVTGASAGFGVAIARRFARDGRSVVALARRLERLERLAAESEGRIHARELDVRDGAAVARTFAAIEADYGGIDVLVNNAGLALGLEPAQAAVLDEWQRMIDTNVSGLVACTHAVLPGMVARDRGHVLNLGSTAAMYPYPGGNVYGATKAFVHQFSLNLRADLVGTKVRVTDIRPGLCSGTEFSNVRFRGDDAKAQAIYDGVEALTADDVADAVHWCATRPAHVNINEIELMPVAQAPGPLAVSRPPRP